MHTGHVRQHDDVCVLADMSCESIGNAWAKDPSYQYGDAGPDPQPSLTDDSQPPVGKEGVVRLIRAI